MASIQKPITVDGMFGPMSIGALQSILGVSQTGKITGQLPTLKKYHKGFSKGISYGVKGDSTVKALQKFLKMSQVDGQLGPNTIKQFQKYIGTNADGYWGLNTSKAAQRWINTKIAPSSSAPASKPSIKIKGMDISAWQDKISKAGFKKAKAAGIKFVILRIGYTGSSSKRPAIDSVFENNYKNAIAAGLPVGVYYYSLATNTALAQAEADFVIKNLKGKTITYPVYIDVEDTTYQSKCSRSTLASVCNTFCKAINAAGYTAGVYASLSWFNNKIGNITVSHTKWVAQYNSTCDYKGAYDMWQYSSSKSVPGIANRVDVNWCYKNFNTAKPPSSVISVVTKQFYSGNLPTLQLIKTNAEVITDTIKWVKWIASDNDFHYGYTNKLKKANAHHNGCYFCKTQHLKKNMLMPEHTYCCNPFVGAAWAHGGCVPAALKLCQNTSSWDFHKGAGYDKSNLFTNLGHPAKSQLKAGDVLCSDYHVAIYIGNGLLAEASSGDDNKKNSTKWNNSIHITSLTDNRYKKFKRVYRFNSSVNTNTYIRHGEVSKRVGQWQKFLNWYFDGKAGTADNIFGDNTLKWTKKFQEEVVGKGQGDGIIGQKTLDAAAKVKK